MKKKIWLRGLLGFPLGIAVGHVISLIISLGWGEGAFLPCVPELIHWMAVSYTHLATWTIVMAIWVIKLETPSLQTVEIIEPWSLK